MGHPSEPRLLVLHTVRLKGIADTPEIADHTGLDTRSVEEQLDAAASAAEVQRRDGRFAGYSLTADGRSAVQELLRDELDASGHRSEVEAAYADFLGFNDRLLAVCTAWQLRDVDGESHVNDHSDPDYDRSVHEQLVALHERMVPVLDALAGALDRFGGHRERLQTALDRVLAGEHDWFTKPRFPSYHSIWFELHEDLLATLGTERATEGSL